MGFLRSLEGGGHFTRGAQILALLALTAVGGCAATARHTRSQCDALLASQGLCPPEAPEPVAAPPPDQPAPDKPTPETESEGPDFFGRIAAAIGFSSRETGTQCRTTREAMPGSGSTTTSKYDPETGAHTTTTVSSREDSINTLCPDPRTGEMVPVTDEIQKHYRDRFLKKLGLTKYSPGGMWSSDGRAFFDIQEVSTADILSEDSIMVMVHLLTQLVSGETTEDRAADGSGFTRTTRKRVNLSGADIQRAQRLVTVERIFSDEGLFAAWKVTVPPESLQELRGITASMGSQR